jgi:hypothetical protein
MRDESNYFVEKAFITLLSDAIEHAYLASQLPNPGSVSRLARSSILNCAVAIESAANACLDTLSLSSRFRTRFERNFSSLEKYEIFLLLRKSEARLDRGCRIVQAIDDLIDLRNDFVHPKVAALQIISGPEDHGAGRVTVSCGRYEYLGIDKSYRTWNGLSSSCVLNAVDQFLDDFLLGLCKYTPQEATRLLCNTIILSGDEKPWVHAGEIELVEKARTIFNLSLQFLDFREINPGAMT